MFIFIFTTWEGLTTAPTRRRVTRKTADDKMAPFDHVASSTADGVRGTGNQLTERWLSQLAETIKTISDFMLIITFNPFGRTSFDRAISRQFQKYRFENAIYVIFDVVLFSPHRYYSTCLYVRQRTGKVLVAVYSYI